MSERLVQGEEAHLTARHLIHVLGDAIVAAARGQWEVVKENCIDAAMFAERLDAMHEVRSGK